MMRMRKILEPRACLNPEVEKHPLIQCNGLALIVVQVDFFYVKQRCKYVALPCMHVPRSHIMEGIAAVRGDDTTKVRTEPAYHGFREDSEVVGCRGEKGRGRVEVVDCSTGADCSKGISTVRGFEKRVSPFQQDIDRSKMWWWISFCPKPNACMQMGIER